MCQTACLCVVRCSIFNSLNNNKMYIVYYTTGSYDDFCRVPIFVTKDESKANSYKDRFNSIRDKWKKYYFEYRDELSCTLIEDIIYYNELGECYVQPIQER